MSYVYGTPAKATTYIPVDNDAQPEDGVIYRAQFVLSGIRTYIPNWEQASANQIKTNIESEYPWAEVTYININGDTKFAEVQFRCSYATSSGEYYASFAIPIGAIIALAIIAVIAYFVMKLVGSVQKMWSSENGTNTSVSFPTILIAGIVVAGIFGIGYIISSMRRGKTEKYVTHMLHSGIEDFGAEDFAEMENSGYF